MNECQKFVHSYRPGALIRVTGEDAFAFLQGQFTNELRQAVGSAVYGLWLNQKGKVMADSQVLRLAESEFRVFSANSSAAAIRQRLEDYIVADDVVLSDETTAVHGLALGGPGGGEIIKELLGVVPAAGRLAQKNEVTVFAGRRTRTENYEIVGPEMVLAELRDRFVARGWVEVETAVMELLRISAGIPAIPQDVGPGDLPNEGGLEESAISYTKGCYLGQEVMARLKNMGRVRRQLHIVRGGGAPPRPQIPLYQGEKKVGEIRSAASNGDDFVALAMLSLINLNPEAGFSLAPDLPPVLRISRHG